VNMASAVTASTKAPITPLVFALFSTEAIA
jgi:hypothetical protein